MSHPLPPESSDPADVTRLLREGARGDRHDALPRLVPLVYDELQRIARQRLRGEPEGHRLSTTALVREAYRRLVDQTRVEWRDGSHFLAVASEAMRRILVDAARHKRTSRHRGDDSGPHGAKGEVTPPDDALTDTQALELIALDGALLRLATFNAEGVRVVLYRFFGGLSNEDIALVMGTSERTVRRTWTMARAWLHRELDATTMGASGQLRAAGETADA